MADDILPGNDNLSTERTLSNVVDELKRVNENEILTRDEIVNTNLAINALESGGSDEKTRKAMLELIEEQRQRQLGEEEERKEDNKRDEFRNRVLSKIADLTKLNLDKLDEAFKDKSGLSILGILARTAITGIIVGVGKGIYDSYKFLFKTIGNITKGITKAFVNIAKFADAKFFNNFFRNKFTQIGTGFVKGFKSAQAGLKNFGQSIKAFFDPKTNKVVAGVMKVGKSITKVFGIVMKALIGIKALFGKFTAILSLDLGSLRKSLGSLPRAMSKFFQPFRIFTNFFNSAAKPIAQNIKSIAKSFGPTAKSANTIAAGVRKFIAGVKPIGTAFGVLGKVGKAFQMFGRQLGRFFLPLTVIFSVVDSVKGAFAGLEAIGEDAGFFSKAAAVLTGAIGGFIKGFFAIPLDMLLKLVSWLAGKLGFDNVKEYLSKFLEDGGLTKMVQDLIDNVINGIKTLATMDFGAIIKNASLDLLKLIKKVALFPSAVAAGAAAALFNLLNDPKAAFIEAFNKKLSMGDAAIDAMKTPTGNMEGEEMIATSQENNIAAMSNVGAMPVVVTDASSTQTDASDKSNNVIIMQSTGLQSSENAYA